MPAGFSALVKTISPETLFWASRNRIEINAVISDVCDTALDGLIGGPDRKRERDGLAIIRLEIETALADLDDVARQIDDPDERAMLTSVVLRILVGGTQLGRFIEPLAFTKALQARRASDLKATTDAARREALDVVVASVAGARGAVSDANANLLRPKVLAACGLPENTCTTKWPTTSAIRKSLARLKKVRT